MASRYCGGGDGPTALGDRPRARLEPLRSSSAPTLAHAVELAGHPRAERHQEVTGAPAVGQGPGAASSTWWPSSSSSRPWPRWPQPPAGPPRPCRRTSGRPPDAQRGRLSPPAPRRRGGPAAAPSTDRRRRGPTCVEQHGGVAHRAGDRQPGHQAAPGLAQLRAEAGSASTRLQAHQPAVGRRGSGSSRHRRRRGPWERCPPRRSRRPAEDPPVLSGWCPRGCGSARSSRARWW
jgi:hypothetical protein